MLLEKALKKNYELIDFFSQYGERPHFYFDGNGYKVLAQEDAYNLHGRKSLSSSYGIKNRNNVYRLIPTANGPIYLSDINLQELNVDGTKDTLNNIFPEMPSFAIEIVPTTSMAKGIFVDTIDDLSSAYTATEKNALGYFANYDELANQQFILKKPQPFLFYIDVGQIIKYINLGQEGFIKYFESRTKDAYKNKLKFNNHV